MPHEPERTFEERVEKWLNETFGQSTWSSHVRLEETGRYPDYWVDLGHVSVAIEVENDWEAAIKGVGQAMLYASHSPNVWPLVVVPKDHVEEPEVSYYRKRSPVAIIEL